MKKCIPLFYELLFVLPVLFILVACGTSVLELDSSVYYAIAMITGFYCTLFKNAKQRYRLILLGVGVFLFLFFGILMGKRNHWELGGENRFMMLGLLASILGFFLAYLVAYLWIAKIVALCLVIGLWILFMQNQWMVPTIGLISGFFFIIEILVSFVQKNWEKSGDLDLRGHVTHLAPFILMIAILPVFGKTSEKPFNWEKTVRVIENVAAEVQMLFQVVEWDGDGSMNSITGYSNKGKLGGDLTDEPKDMLKLKLSKSSYMNALYLTGKTFDSFDGREWHTNFDTSKKHIMLDTMESICGSQSISSYGMQDFMLPVTMEVTYLRMKTRTVFLPIKSITSTKEFQDMGMHSTDYGMEFTIQKGFHTTYHPVFYVLNRNHPDFHTYLDADHTFGPPQWTYALKQQHLDKEKGLTLSDLFEYRKSIQKWDGQKPEISQELQDYLSKYMSGANTKGEKLERLKALFREFQYTKVPGDLPAKITSPKEFLDYFVLEKREGHCGYFASAFVLLARYEGIPARYVQGYRVELQNQTEVIVSSNMAHAWPEAYVEGIGWIPYEPTPGYQDTTKWKTYADLMKNREQIGERQVVKGTGVSGGRSTVDIATTYETTTEEALETDELEETKNLSMSSSEEAINEIQDETDAFKEEAFTGRDLITYLILGIFLLFILSTVIYLITLYFQKRNFLKQLNLEQKSLLYCHRCITLLHSIGYTYRFETTLQDFKKEVGTYIRGRDKEVLFDFLDCYELLSYGIVKDFTSMEKRMAYNYDSILHYIKKNQKTTYWFYLIWWKFSKE